MESNTLTIGELASRVGMRTSTLRYYEEQGLLTPLLRSPAGYRIYSPQAEQVLLFIQRAQRLGFSLADIRALLEARQDGRMDEETLLSITSQRYLAIERELTRLLVLRHELGLLLADLPGRGERGLRMDDPQVSSFFEHLLERVCAGPRQPSSAEEMLDWLMTYTGCALTTMAGHALIDRLRGRHVHLWMEGERVSVLVIGHDPGVWDALQELAQLEAQCHAHPVPQIEETSEGYLFTAHGENAFIFARLFLSLEGESRLG
jgi:MerR family transcriptional regulator, copper efflux regulator